MTTSLNSSKHHGVTRRKTSAYAVTPTTHGVTTAYAVYVGKPIQTLNYTYGVKHGVPINLSHTPVTAIHSMA
jgi:hypothetical protein